MQLLFEDEIQSERTDGDRGEVSERPVSFGNRYFKVETNVEPESEKDSCDQAEELGGEKAKAQILESAQ